MHLKNISKILLRLSIPFFKYFFSKIDINKSTESSTVPACPNLACFLNRGNTDGNNSSKTLCVMFVSGLIWSIWKILWSDDFCAEQLRDKLMFAFSPDPSWSTGLKVPTNQLTSHQIGVSQSMKSMINVLKKSFLFDWHSLERHFMRNRSVCFWAVYSLLSELTRFCRGKWIKGTTCAKCGYVSVMPTVNRGDYLCQVWICQCVAYSELRGLLVPSVDMSVCCLQWIEGTTCAKCGCVSVLPTVH